MDIDFWLIFLNVFVQLFKSRLRFKVYKKGIIYYLLEVIYTCVNISEVLPCSRSHKKYAQNNNLQNIKKLFLYSQLTLISNVTILAKPMSAKYKFTGVYM